MIFDAMANAADWLNAYRRADLECILDLYAAHAEIHCGCGGMKIIRGRVALRAYWVQRFVDYPASDRVDFQPAGDSVFVLTYICNGYPIRATLEFSAQGKINYSRCGPSN